MGNEIEFRLDPGSIGEWQVTPENLVNLELVREFVDNKVIPEKYWYISPGGAEQYLKLNSLVGSHTYHFFNDSREILSENRQEMVKEIFNWFEKIKEKNSGNKDNGGQNIEYISLGSGTMYKESGLLDQLLSTNRFRGLTDKIKFSPVDISMTLLLNGIKGIHQKFGNDMATQKLEVTPRLKDFYMQNFDYDGSNKNFRIITAFDIISNATIPGVFYSIRKIMNSNTLLLIDVDMTSDPDKLKKSYEDKYVKEILAMPLRMIFAAANDNNINQIMEKGHYNNIVKYIERPGENKNLDELVNIDDIHVEITTATELREFIKKHGLPDNAYHNIQINNYKDSLTVVVMYKPKESHLEPCVLGYSTKFSEEGFKAMLADEKVGLKLVRKEPWKQKGKSALFYLLALHTVFDKDEDSNTSFDDPGNKIGN